MKRALQMLGIYIGLLFSFGSTADTVPADDSRPAAEWNFRVFLDDKEIGYHNFQLTGDGSRQKLTTEAEFRVRFLFFTAYSYEHENQEIWSGNCLEKISSKTDANGKQFVVRGYEDDGRFEVEINAERTEVRGCVKTFAYWNPDILDEPALMNSQTGEILPVTIEPVAEEVLNVRGVDTSATRYQLRAEGMALDIWYSSDKRWLALESTVKGGRTLRYELT